MANPMEQFEIKRIGELTLGGYDVAFTNSSLWMMIALVTVSGFLFIGTAAPRLVPGRWQASVEYIEEFVRNMLAENVGPEGLRYVPLVFSIFIFVLACNLLGMIPWVGSFTPTSHVAVTLGLAALVFIVVLIVGFARHGLHFLSLFVPKDCPVVLLPLVTLIEFVSFLSRPFTLAVRLFANMTAGHVLLKVFGTFVVSLGVFGILPLGVNVALTALEVMIAVVQAYVFALLTSIYLNDAVNLH